MFKLEISTADNRALIQLLCQVRLPLSTVELVICLEGEGPWYLPSPVALCQRDRGSSLRALLFINVCGGDWSRRAPPMAIM